MSRSVRASPVMLELGSLPFRRSRTVISNTVAFSVKSSTYSNVYSSPTSGSTPKNSAAETGGPASFAMVTMVISTGKGPGQQGNVHFQSYGTLSTGLLPYLGGCLDVPFHGALPLANRTNPRPGTLLHPLGTRRLHLLDGSLDAWSTAAPSIQQATAGARWPRPSSLASKEQGRVWTSCVVESVHWLPLIVLKYFTGGISYSYLKNPVEEYTRSLISYAIPLLPRTRFPSRSRRLESFLGDDSFASWT